MHHDPTFLQGLWFVLISVLWIGFFVLEGFDFGVGMLVHFLGRNRNERRALIHTIGPVWDGNEVWLLTAGGATFAAFPGWYASTFSGFYLALFLVLVALIVRGVSFEFWGKVDSPRWRSIWEWALAVSSGAAALLFGVAFADFVHGVPMDAHHVVHASLLDLLHPYALLGGVTTLTLFLAHGANFLALRTSGELEQRARATANRAAPVAGAALTAFLAWTVIDVSWNGALNVPVLILAIATATAGALMPYLARRSESQAFAAGAAAIALLIVTLMAGLYPNAIPSTTSHAFDLTLSAASSTSYTLTVMTVVAVIFVPIVLAYQSWTYWVFRHRLGAADFDHAPTPLDTVDKLLSRNSGKPPVQAG